MKADWEHPSSAGLQILWSAGLSVLLWAVGAGIVVAVRWACG